MRRERIHRKKRTAFNHISVMGLTTKAELRVILAEGLGLIKPLSGISNQIQSCATQQLDDIDFDSDRRNWLPEWDGKPVSSLGIQNTVEGSLRDRYAIQPASAQAVGSEYQTLDPAGLNCRIAWSGTSSWASIRRFEGAGRTPPERRGRP